MYELVNQYANIFNAANLIPYVISAFAEIYFCRRLDIWVTQVIQIAAKNRAAFLL